MIKNKYLIIIYLTISLTLTAQNEFNPDNQFRLAQSYIDAGQIEKAELILKELINKYPTNYTYFDALTKILIRQKKYSEAIYLIENKISETPQDLNLYGLLGSVYFMADYQEKAYDIWERGLKLSPGLVVAYRIIANYAIESRALDKAIEILQKGKNISNEPEIFSLDLINLFLANLRFENAANEICDLIVKKPDHLANIKVRINYYSDNKNALKKFIDVLENRIKEISHPALYDLLAYNYSLMGNYDFALKLLIVYEKKINGNGNTILSFAQNAYQNGEYEIALKAYDYLIKQNKNPQMLHLLRYYYSSSLEQYYNKKIKNETISWKPYNELKMIYINELKNVVKSYEEILKDYNFHPMYSQILYRMAEIYFNRLNEYQKAESLYTIINLKAPNTDFSILSFLKKGNIALLNNRLKEAISYYEKVLVNNRSNLNHKSEANYYIGMINFWMGNFNKALKYLTETTKVLSNDYANNALELLSLISTARKDSLNLLKFATADLLLFQKRFDEAYGQFEELANNKDLFLLNEFSTYKLAEILIALDNYPRAINVLEELLENSKTMIFADKSLFLIGKVYQYGLKDNIKAIQIYQKLLEKFPNSLYFEIVREYLNELQIKNG